MPEDTLLKEGGVPSTGGRGRGNEGKMEAREQTPPTEIVLRWLSALPLKQAIARANFGEKAETAPQAVKSLSRQEDRYVVGVFYLPALVLQGKAADAKAGCTLKVKGKPEIQAESVVPDTQAGAPQTAR